MTAIGGGGGGGTNQGGGGVTNSVCASKEGGGGGGGATNAGVGLGATMCECGGTGDVFAAPPPALKIEGRLALLSCPEVRAFTESGGPVVVEILEGEPGPVRRVF